jgi:hypothetical protein
MLRFARACGYLTAMRTRRGNDRSAFGESMGSLIVALPSDLEDAHTGAAQIADSLLDL